jgi:uncharacterized repeat protein (TIGR01451 family)
MDNAGATDAGSVYVFDTNGVLLATMTNPAPANADYFGYSVAGVGLDKVVVGAHGDDAGATDAGRAYIFDTNGLLLATLANPAPGSYDFFGCSVAGVGSDKVVVGAWGDDAGATPSTGRAFIFSTSGVLLATMTNAAQATGDDFGYAVASVGSDKVIVGAHGDDAGTTNAGSVYIFDTNGLLLATLANPSSAGDDGFGHSVAGLESNRVVVGVLEDNAGAPDSGSVYLFDLSGGGARIQNTAALTASSPVDANSANDSGTVAIVVGSEADVSVTKAGAYPVLPGGATNTYVITVTNNGPDAATGIRLSEFLPADLWILSAIPDMGSFDELSHGWKIGRIEPGESASLTLTARILGSWSFATLTNAASYNFGCAVAGLGSDRVIVGDNSRRAHIFDTSGVLQVTITNPSPGLPSFNFFGSSVAGVGSDKVVVGAPGENAGAERAGSAYLFDTNGVLLVTMTNPAPAEWDYFGCSVAGLGSDRVVVGAYRDGASEAGMAYLFYTNGVLLATMNNPTPAVSDWFGASVAGVGTDKVVVGAYRDDAGATDAGRAYIFNTNGLLLATLANPTPASEDYFGYSVAGLGSNKVVVGAYRDDLRVADVGGAYIFDVNGTLLTTITNPAMRSGDGFGYSVAGLGQDKVVVGAVGHDAGETGAGRAYIFDLSGVLLAVLPNPVPAYGDSFGWSVAGLGSDKVVVGTPLDGVVEMDDAGSAYLFSFRGGERVVTNRVTVSSAQLDADVENNVAADVLTVLEVFTLDVISLYGAVVPGVGSHAYLAGTILTNYAFSPDTRDTTQYVCAGWALSGNEPAGGDTTQLVMTVTNHAALTWLWTTNYWLATTAGLHGTVQPPSDWQSFGSNVEITATADLFYHFTNWSGDVPGGDEFDHPLNLLMSEPKSVEASFAENLAPLGTPEWWLALHNLTNNGFSFAEAETNDADGDHDDARHEFVADTVPTNELSQFRLLAVQAAPSAKVTFSCTNSRVYTLQYLTNLVRGSWTYVSNQTNISGEADGSMLLTDTNGASQRFYGVGVGPP